MIRYLYIFVILVLLSTKSFSYELSLGLGYGKTNYKYNNSSSISAILEGYVPFLFTGLKLGLGISYFGVNLGSSSNLINEFIDDYIVPSKDVTMSLFPMYVALQYELYLRKELSTFISGYFGFPAGRNEYFFEYLESSLNKRSLFQEKKSMEIYGNMISGISLGVYLYNKYILSLSYEKLNLKNSYHYISGEDSVIGNIETITNIENMERVLFRLSYVFR